MAGEVGYNESSVVLPSLFGPPGAALENAIGRQQQDKMMQYRLKKDEQREREADEWRKANLINELTDLTKYQTPDSAANKIGEDRASDVLKKYTSAAKEMSPYELLAGIKKDMQDVHIGMNAINDEFTQAHLMAAELKKQDPTLDAGALEVELRKDIADRRINADTSFVPQMKVLPMGMGKYKINLNDDRYLSKFVSSDKELREAIQNPKGTDPSRFPVGNFEKNMEYEANVAPWRVGVSQDELQKGGGFLKEGTVPKLGFKEQAIPTDLLKSKDGKQLMGVTPEVFDGFMSDRKLKRQVINNARVRYKEYDDEGTSDEKKTAMESATLREMLGELDKTQYRQVGTPQRARQPKTSNVFNFGGAGGGGLTKGNAFDDIGDEDFGKFKFSDGAVYNSDGSPKTGEIFITGDKIPSSIKTALNSGGIDPKLLIGGVNAKVKDGKIESISNKAIGTVTRQAMEGVYQKKADTEPLKGDHLEFAPSGQKPKNKPPLSSFIKK